MDAAARAEMQTGCESGFACLRSLGNLDAPNVAVVLCREGDSCLLGRRLELRQPQSAQDMLPQLLIWDPCKPAKNARLYQALQIVGLTS